MNQLNEVATIAGKLGKKTNKTQAYHIIMQMIEHDEMPSQDEMAELYSHFMPGLPAKPKFAWQWAARALAKQDVRFYLQFFHSDDGTRLVATDEHRLHILNDYSGLKKGAFYDKAMNKCTVDHDYPQIERVIPKNWHDFQCHPQSAFESFERKCTANAKWGDLVLVPCENSEHESKTTAFNSVYFADAVRNMDDARIYVQDANSSAVIEGTVLGEKATAIVMPVRQ